jgi:hypothetical protein
VFPSSPPQAFSLAQATGMQGFFLKCVGCFYEHLGIRFNWFVNRLSVQVTSGDKEVTGGIEKVGSTGCGAACECQDGAQKVGTTILFRHKQSEDTKSAFEECWLHTCRHSILSLPTAKPCVHTHTQNSFIHWLMSYLIFTQITPCILSDTTPVYYYLKCHKFRSRQSSSGVYVIQKIQTQCKFFEVSQRR